MVSQHVFAHDHEGLRPHGAVICGLIIGDIAKSELFLTQFERKMII
jgi:hypothetical protein